MANGTQRSSNALDPFLEEAGCALFAAMDTPVTSVARAGAPVAEEASVMGVVGFVNEQMSGALCVIASVEVAAELRPRGTDDSTPSQAALLDGINELANMLLGRIKTLLARRGISVLLSTPTASISEKLRVSPPPTEGAAWYAFTLPQGPVYARIALRIDPALVLDGACTERRMEPMAEGEMMMLLPKRATRADARTVPTKLD